MLVGTEEVSNDAHARKMQGKESHEIHGIRDADSIFVPQLDNEKSMESLKDLFYSRLDEMRKLFAGDIQQGD